MKMKEISPQERRLHARRKHRTRIVFEDEFNDGLFYVFSEDISMGGVFLASDIPLRVGTLLFLSFQLPQHKRPIRVTGEVVRRISPEGEEGPPARLASRADMKSGEARMAGGMGVRFIGLSDMALKRLEDFLNE